MDENLLGLAEANVRRQTYQRVAKRGEFLEAISVMAHAKVYGRESELVMAEKRLRNAVRNYPDWEHDERRKEAEDRITRTVEVLRHNGGQQQEPKPEPAQRVAAQPAFQTLTETEVMRALEDYHPGNTNPVTREFFRLSDAHLEDWAATMERLGRIPEPPVVPDAHASPMENMALQFMIKRFYTTILPYASLEAEQEQEQGMRR